MRRVIVESPYAGDIERNVRYARACLRDCIQRGESPYASHLLYTQEGVLRGEVAEERRMGIEAGFVWRYAAQATVVYADLGISKGMWSGIEHAARIGKHAPDEHTIEIRYLGGEWASDPGGTA